MSTYIFKRVGNRVRFQVDGGAWIGENNSVSSSVNGNAIHLRIGNAGALLIDTGTDTIQTDTGAGPVTVTGTALAQHDQLMTDIFFLNSSGSSGVTPVNTNADLAGKTDSFVKVAVDELNNNEKTLYWYDGAAYQRVITQP
jgi:hypothetical protein